MCFNSPVTTNMIKSPAVEKSRRTACVQLMDKRNKTKLFHKPFKASLPHKMLPGYALISKHLSWRIIKAPLFFF